MPFPPYQPALIGFPRVSAELQSRIEADYHRFAKIGRPADFETYLLAEYEIDLRSSYAGVPIKNPWGKASGQLSMTAHQVADDVSAGLGFVVLKTVIAEDETGSRSMQAWAVPEARMVVEKITGRSGEVGWTVSWKGRGWWQSFADYLELIRDVQQIAQGAGTLIVPSCKFNLPTPEEPEWKIKEYEYTVPKLLEAWQNVADDSSPMPLEKDFSPTLAGSDLAKQQAQILEWLETVPRLIRSAKIDHRSVNPVRIGLKIFNALFEDEFQLEMLRKVHEAGTDRADFFIYGNRLFDPDREFEGHKGIAYGGPDLSDRNLRVMSAFQRELLKENRLALEWSATGNITTGKMALEYALLGASSFQLHTFFQLPNDQYAMNQGSRTERALHELYFHPETGFLIWMLDLAERLRISRQPVRFSDVIGRGSDLAE